MLSQWMTFTCIISLRTYTFALLRYTAFLHVCTTTRANTASSAPIIYFLDKSVNYLRWQLVLQEQASASKVDKSVIYDDSRYSYHPPSDIYFRFLVCNNLRWLDIH